MRTTSENTGKTGVPQESGAESGASSGDSAPIDPDLAAVVSAWPTLPYAIRAAVLAIVRAPQG